MANGEAWRWSKLNAATAEGNVGEVPQILVFGSIYGPHWEKRFSDDAGDAGFPAALISLFLSVLTPEQVFEVP